MTKYHDELLVQTLTLDDEAALRGSGPLHKSHPACMSVEWNLPKGSIHLYR